MIKSDEIKRYLENFNLAKVSDKLLQELNKEVTDEDIKEAINNMKRNKTPGPEGFTALFY